MPSATTMLKQDHRTVEKLFMEFEAQATPNEVFPRMDCELDGGRLEDLGRQLEELKPSSS